MTRKQITLWNISCEEVVWGLFGFLHPLVILSFLPKRFQERYIDYVWDHKKDHEIRSAYFDAVEWIEVSFGELMDSDTLDDIAKGCIVKLRDTIWPQIEKRGMQHRLDM